MITAREKAYMKLKELNLLAPIEKKVKSQKTMYVAPHLYKIEEFVDGDCILRGENGITYETMSPVYHSWDKMVDHLDTLIEAARNYIHENSNFACCEGWVKIEFDLVNHCYIKDFEERLDENPTTKEALEKVNGVWQTKAEFLDGSEEMKEIQDLLNRILASEYATTVVTVAGQEVEPKKRGFFEMEMVDQNSLDEFINELEDNGCKFLMEHTDNIGDDEYPLYEVVSVYGEIPEEYEDLILDDSLHGYNHLKDEFEIN